MDSGTATVLAATITGFMALIGVLLKFWTENRQDHGRVMEVLNRMTLKLDRVDRRVSKHIDWHLDEGGHGGETVAGDHGSKTTKEK